MTTRREQPSKEPAAQKAPRKYVTDAIKALIGVRGERIEASLWGVEREGLRRFCHAVMDPDPRYWDEEFAKTTRYGGIITPPMYVTTLNKRPPGAEDDVSKAAKENPAWDGVTRGRGRGGLPEIRMEGLPRNLNAGNEMEFLQYGRLGERIYSQARIADIVERVGRDGTPFVVTTTETIYTNEKGEVLCITRASGLRR